MIETALLDALECSQLAKVERRIFALIAGNSDLLSAS